VESPVDGDDEVAAAITAFQTGLFAHMGVSAVPVITRTAEAYQVVLEGADIGALIGRRGETLDAIQQLTGYAVNRGRGKRVRIYVDAEGYRARREESLRRLAEKTAAKVARYHRNVTLEPMNAYERHIIHAALQDVANISTYSTGTEPNRRTVVAYDPNKK
jgi:spoIIIJ-associated protein